MKKCVLIDGMKHSLFFNENDGWHMAHTWVKTWNDATYEKYILKWIKLFVFLSATTPNNIFDIKCK